MKFARESQRTHQKTTSERTNRSRGDGKSDVYYSKMMDKKMSIKKNLKNFSAIVRDIATSTIEKPFTKTFVYLSRESKKSFLEIEKIN